MVDGARVDDDDGELSDVVAVEAGRPSPATPSSSSSLPRPRASCRGAGASGPGDLLEVGFDEVLGLIEADCRWGVAAAAARSGGALRYRLHAACEPNGELLDYLNGVLLGRRDWRCVMNKRIGISYKEKNPALVWLDDKVEQVSATARLVDDDGGRELHLPIFGHAVFNPDADGNHDLRQFRLILHEKVIAGEALVVKPRHGSNSKRVSVWPRPEESDEPQILASFEQALDAWDKSWKKESWNQNNVPKGAILQPMYAPMIALISPPPLPASALPATAALAAAASQEVAEVSAPEAVAPEAAAKPLTAAEAEAARKAAATKAVREATERKEAKAKAQESAVAATVAAKASSPEEAEAAEAVATASPRLAKPLELKVQVLFGETLGACLNTHPQFLWVTREGAVHVWDQSMPGFLARHAGTKEPLPEAVVDLLRRELRSHWPWIRRSSERLARAVGLDELRVDWLLGDPRWGPRIGELTYMGTFALDVMPVSQRLARAFAAAHLKRLGHAVVDASF